MILAAELFGSKHIMGLVISLVVIGLMFVVSEILVKKNTKVMLFVILGLFYVLEIIKIAYMWINKGGYPMNHLPFHLCSLPLYVMPLIAFVKNEKVLKFIYPAVVGGLLFGGVIALLYPVNIIGEGTSFLPIGENFLPWLSFVYHPLMVYTGIYVIYSGLYKIKFSSFVNAYPLIVAFMLLAMIANKIFDKDFMLLNYGNGSPFEFLRDSSQLLYTASMIGLGLIGIFLFHSIAFVLAKVTKPKENEVYSYTKN